MLVTLTEYSRKSHGAAEFIKILSNYCQTCYMAKCKIQITGPANVLIFPDSPQNNDLMKNTVHRHEPPVVCTPLEILADDGEVLVVNKPASIPVHPCGRFRHNTVIFILGKERGVSELHTVHRLDRLTSGVLLFARTLETSKKLDQLVRDRQVC